MVFELFGVSAFPSEFDTGFCWADFDDEAEEDDDYWESACGEQSVNDFGLCLIHYVAKVGRLPCGYTQEDVRAEIQRRKEEHSSF